MARVDALEPDPRGEDCTLAHDPVPSALRLLPVTGAIEAAAWQKRIDEWTAQRSGEAISPFFKRYVWPVGRTTAVNGPAEVTLAESWLVAATTDCAILLEPMATVHAYRDLGQLREKQGCRREACAAYQRVIVRWGAARPRSVTAEWAKRRMAILKCHETALAPVH